MNILVISDSHRDAAGVRSLLDIYASQVQFAVHLGDYVNDILQFKSEFPLLNIETVQGNCDGYSRDDAVVFLSVNGRKILLTHGHRHNVKAGYDRLMYFAEENDADACLFGHTHRPDTFEYGKCVFLNPGSLGQPYPGEPPSYGILKIAGSGVITASLLRFKR